MRTSHAIAAGLATAATIACGASENGAPRTSDTPRSTVPIERLFPLQNGYVYSYVTSGDSGVSTALIALAGRSSPTSGELRWGSAWKRFEYKADGIVNASTGVYILKEPLTVGASWRGERGLTRVVSIDAAPVVPAGRFAACVETLEERGGDLPVRVVTVFCPDVGIVAFEASSGMGLERAELKSFAPSVDLGPDGLIITKP